MVVQSMPDANPIKWHLAYTTWFFDTFHSQSPGSRLSRVSRELRLYVQLVVLTVGHMHAAAPGGRLEWSAPRPLLLQLLPIESTRSAPAGHAPTQAPHPLQRSANTAGRERSSHRIAPSGQRPLQLIHVTRRHARQRSRSTCASPSSALATGSRVVCGHTLTQSPQKVHPAVSKRR